ncbi:metallophosphoesterase family protein [Phenylobacterium sp.]|uniref:metallophosphoesterase family protein n=1 Tax=Phenylobacterium sp. TaxID=1871053 RepID=UPI0025F62D00|nr:metallophosphoesterase family protein [Phenylobacterium sp.]
MTARALTFDAGIVAILADCHIHPGDGPEFPAHVLAALSDAHLIVTLGDMGDSAGLDQLEEIATVVGVRGQDDADDPRTDHPALLLHIGGTRVGCVFDATAAGLATASDPFTPAADFAEACRRLFGTEVDVLLHASTHKAATDAIGRQGVALNPGSAILPAAGAAPTFGRLVRTAAGLEPEIVFVG